MKCLIVTIVIAAMAYAEPPPSKSYLPPSPISRNAGYPKGPQSAQGFNGGPQVVAARTLEGQGNHAFGHNHGQNGHDAESLHGNGFGRSSVHSHSGAQGRHGDQQGYDHNAAAFGRNAVDADDEPANYNFGYMVNDHHEGTEFGHQEERHEERAEGEYHVVLPDGRKQTVSYHADERGFKPQISYEESEDLNRSGYDSNANNARSGYDSNANNARSGYDSNANHSGYDSNANGYHGNGNHHDVENFGRNAERGHGADFPHHADGFGRNGDSGVGRNAETGFGRNAENGFGRNAENGNGKSRSGY